MGIRYEHITIEERCEISRLRASGQSIRQVAATLDRSPSTISRELKRNVSRIQGYRPKYADQQAQERRWCGSRLERDKGLRSRCSPASGRTGPRSKWQDAWPWRLAGPSFPMRLSTVSSMPGLPARRTTPGVITCPGPSRNAAGGDARGAVRRPSWLTGALWRNVLKRLLTGRRLATGRLT